MSSKLSLNNYILAGFPPRIFLFYRAYFTICTETNHKQKIRDAFVLHGKL